MRRLYRELGGRDAYWRTPMREVQELELSMVAEDELIAERNAEVRRAQEEQMRRQQQQTGRR